MHLIEGRASNTNVSGHEQPGSPKTGGDHLACIVETSGGLLMAALRGAGLPVYPLNPKTDAIAAYLLARSGRSDLQDLRRRTPATPIIKELTDRGALVQSQTRLVTQLTACLTAYYPVALVLFGQLHPSATLAFLQAFPTLDEAKGAGVIYSA